MKTENHAGAGDTEPFKDSPDNRRRIDSSLLFGERNEIVIVHNDEEYRLRITRADKLILTK